MNKPEFVYETYIRSSAEKIYRAITTAEFTRRYFHAMDIESDWSKGSPVVFRGADGNARVEGTVLEADPPHRLAYTWRFLMDDTMAAERPSRVTYEIEVQGEVCRLRVTHEDFADDSKVLPMISEGWAPILSSLKSLLETGEPLPVLGNEPDAVERGAA